MDRETFEPSPPADVEVAGPDADDRWTLVLVRDLRHPPERVWAALTDPAELSEWAPFLADRDLGTVGDAVLTMVDGDTREPTRATVDRAEPPRLLEYTWGDGKVRWELDAAGTGTRLTLRHTLPQPEMVPMVTAGWHICLDVAERLLDGTPVGPIRGSDARNFGWEELRRTYAEKLDIPDAEA